VRSLDVEIGWSPSASFFDHCAQTRFERLTIAADHDYAPSVDRDSLAVETDGDTL
jgi:hypothetical protein